MRAGTKAFSCVTRQFSKEVRGKIIDLARCGEKLTDSFARTEAKGECPTIGDAATALSLVTDAADAVFVDLAADTVSETEVPCLLSKVKTTVHYARCESEALAKRLTRVYLGLQEDFANCGTAHSIAFGRTENEGECATIDDSRAIRNSAGGGYGFLPDVDWAIEDFGVSSDYFHDAELPNARLVNNDLTFAEFYGANLAGADLTDANVSHSNWATADLSGADFSGADLSHSSINSSSVLDANLGTTNLTNLRATEIVGCPASLPGTWQCRGDVLVGPTARLDDTNLGGLDLSGTDLSGAELGQSFLVNTNLAGASLVGATMRYADSVGADLSGTDLTGADAFGTVFDGADLTGAILTNANFGTARFVGANLTGADLTSANLNFVKATELLGCPAVLPADWKCISGTLVGPNVDLSNADLSGLDLSGTNLSSAFLSGANLTGVNLSTATLTNVLATSLAACPASLPAGWGCLANALVGPTAEIRSVDFDGMDFSGLDLTGALFWFCDLSNVTFDSANLSSVDWYYATCPDGFRTTSSDSCCGHLIDVPSACTP